MANYDSSFGISEEKFKSYYGEITNEQLNLFKYHAQIFLYITKNMYEYDSESNQANPEKIISLKYIHNVILLMKYGILKMPHHTDSEIREWIKKLVKMNPFDFQKYILTERAWPVKNKTILNNILAFLNKNGLQELDIFKNLLGKLQNVSLTIEEMDAFLESLEPVNS